MKKNRILYILVISFLQTLLILFPLNLSAQNYQRFYSDNSISAQIRPRGYKDDGYDPECLYIRNKSSEMVTVFGYAKIRYTYKRVNKDPVYTIKTFSIELPAAEWETAVNLYYKPSDARYGGWDEPVGFYIDEIKKRTPVHIDNSYSEDGKGSNSNYQDVSNDKYERIIKVLDDYIENKENINRSSSSKTDKSADIAFERNTFKIIVPRAQAYDVRGNPIDFYYNKNDIFKGNPTTQKTVVTFVNINGKKTMGFFKQSDVKLLQ